MKAMAHASARICFLSGPAAYSNLAALPGGTIGLLYEAGCVHPYETISFARFSVEWLSGEEER